MLTEDIGEDGDGVTAKSKREAGYCFSSLDLAFLYFSEKHFAKALDALSQISQAAANEEADRHSQLKSEAAFGRSDARQLAMGIRVALGAEFLHRDASHANQGFAYWGEALKDVDAIDEGARLLERKGEEIREQMQAIIGDRIAQLEEGERWNDALTLAEGLTRLIPRESTLQNLVTLLVSRAIQCANKEKDYGTSIDLLRRAKLLVPDNLSVPKHLLAALHNHTGQLLERKEYRAAAENALDLLGVARNILSRSENDREAAEASTGALMLLTAAAEELDVHANQDILKFRFVRKTRGRIRVQAVCQVSDRVRVRGSGTCGSRRIFS